MDETYDRDYSSDGLSRYGAYLRQKRTMFDRGDGPTDDAASFALAAWCVARSIDRWRWRGWERHGHDPSLWVVPYDNDRPAAYTMVTLRIPLDGAALPRPRYRAGVADTATAKQAVWVLCGLLNDQVDPVLDALGDTG